MVVGTVENYNGSIEDSTCANQVHVTDEMKEEAERIKNEANVAFRGTCGCMAGVAVSF